MAATRAASPTGPVILCYDGSKEAGEAIAYAGELLRGLPAVVISVWKPIIEEELSPAMTPPVADPVDANPRQRKAAEQFAAHGIKLASDAGFEAEPVVAKADGPLWEAIEIVAEERDARLVVCGARGRGVKAALPSNLSTALVMHASRPVLVVPSVKAATERLRDIQDRRRRPAMGKAVAAAAGRAKQIASQSRSPRRGQRR
jgi:nucleotide-binding universal stress UspA family protein